MPIVDGSLHWHLAKRGGCHSTGPSGRQWIAARHVGDSRQHPPDRTSFAGAAASVVNELEIAQQMWDFPFAESPLMGFSSCYSTFKRGDLMLTKKVLITARDNCAHCCKSKISRYLKPSGAKLSPLNDNYRGYSPLKQRLNPEFR
jgi:hypothetical protein